MNENIGERIRKLREAQDLNLEQVAKMTGIPAERLGAFESGEEVPSIGMVIKVSRVLGSRMGHILHERGAQRELFSICRAAEFSVVGRKGGPQRDTEQGYTYQAMIRDDMVGQTMEPFLVTFDPEKGADVNPMAHEGEEFIQVVSGQIELEYGDETYLLEEGDTIYLDSSKPHAFRGIGSGKPKMMAIIYSGS